MNTRDIYKRVVFLWIPSLLIALSGALISCFENPERPKIETIPITETTEGLLSGGIITSDGGSEIIEKGICFGSQPGTSILSGRMMLIGGGNEFLGTVPLTPGTSIYLRAYAINGGGIGYGNEFFYSSVSVYLQSVYEITGTTALCSGVAISDDLVTSRGVCWSTTEPPTINDNKAEAGSGIGSFNVQITGLANGTRYYVRPFAVGQSGVFYGGTVSFTTASAPTLTTKEINNPGTFIPNTGGIITGYGGLPVTKTGVCWSTHSSPTIDDSRTEIVTYNNTFKSELPGLLPNTTYYVRAYATNAVGTGYGNERMFTTPPAAMIDADGNTYSSVTIGTQVWIIENLRTTKYNNGDEIMNLVDQADWLNTNSGAWSYYENLEMFNHPYGKLYNWFAVTDARNLCATGWHVPSDVEWSTLFEFTGGIDVAAPKLQEAGDVHWSLHGNGTNSSGFTALPGGSRNVDFYSHPIGLIGVFWGTTSANANEAWGYNLGSPANVYRLAYLVRSGFSVRCVKD